MKFDSNLDIEFRDGGEKESGRCGFVSGGDASVVQRNASSTGRRLNWKPHISSKS